MKNDNLNKINMDTSFAHMIDYISLVYLTDEVYLCMMPIVNNPCGVKGYKCEIMNMKDIHVTLTVKFGGHNEIMEFFTI